MRTDCTRYQNRNTRSARVPSNPVSHPLVLQAAMSFYVIAVCAVPVGLGDPVFEKLDANLAKAILSFVPARALKSEPNSGAVYPLPD